MSESNPSKVYLSEGDDPEMLQAFEQARKSFRYFWREMAWEKRRIIPGLDLAAVKAPFSDGDSKPNTSGIPSVEQMWISDIEFDGQVIRGELLNSPNWLKSVKAGDQVETSISELSDWMYAISGQVYGAYTVNLLRSRMKPKERRDHDNAWGLDFGDPAKIRIVPETGKGGGLLKGLFGKKTDAIEEHPMSVNMAKSLKEQLAKDPSFLTSTDHRGWSLLHQEALAGSAPTVKVLLEAGADRNAKTKDGKTPLQLAESLGWTNVVALLTSAP